MYPEMLKYRVNLTETEKVIALPLWLKAIMVEREEKGRDLPFREQACTDTASGQGGSGTSQLLPAASPKSFCKGDPAVCLQGHGHTEVIFSAPSPCLT